MVNRGIAPPDFDTPVGQFRSAYPDLTYVALDPPETGFGDYAELSDLEIQGFLARGAGSVNRGIGFYYLQLAGAASKRSKTVKDYDLTVDLTKRSNELRTVAQIYFDLADADDALVGEDAFQIVPTGTSCGPLIPEATIPQWGRRYVRGRWC